MSIDSRKALVVAAIVAFGLVAVLPCASAQTTARIPDLSGVYNIRTFRGGPLETMAVDLPGGKIPLLPTEEPRYRAFAKKQMSNPDPADDQSPSAHCLPPGLTFLMTAPYPIEIIQTPTKVLTFHEFGNFVRQIFLNRSGHGDPDPTWLGHSIGHYEGDTLVVDTVGFNGKAWLDLTGLRGTDVLHTVERFRKVNGELEWTVTIEDKKMFTQPFVVQAMYRPLPDFDINEYVCLENNTMLGSPGMKIAPAR